MFLNSLQLILMTIKVEWALKMKYIEEVRAVTNYREHHSGGSGVAHKHGKYPPS